MACLGQITTHHRLEDGTYNLLLLGLQRVRIVQELEPSKPYREAQVELCRDQYPLHETAIRGALQNRLRESLVRVLPSLPEAHEQMDQLLAADIPLGVLTDVVSFMLDIPPGQKAAWLAEMNVHRRAEMLLEHLANPGGTGCPPCRPATFPPQFSVN